MQRRTSARMRVGDVSIVMAELGAMWYLSKRGATGERRPVKGCYKYETEWDEVERWARHGTRDGIWPSFWMPFQQAKGIPCLGSLNLDLAAIHHKLCAFQEPGLKPIMTGVSMTQFAVLVAGVHSPMTDCLGPGGRPRATPTSILQGSWPPSRLLQQGPKSASSVSDDTRRETFTTWPVNMAQS